MKIILDSTCDLPKEFIDKYSIDIVPVYILIDEKAYLDGVDITYENFYQYLREHQKNLPKTSGASPKGFIDKINENIEKHSKFFISTISSKLSTTFQSARIAIKRFKNVKINLVDSLSGSGGVGLLGLNAAILDDEGENDDIIIKKATYQRDNSIGMGYVNDLTNLIHSGRISHLKYYIAKLLNAKPVLKIKDGVITSDSTARGREKGLEKLVERVVERTKESKDNHFDMMITHGDDLEHAQYVADSLEDKINVDKKIINYLSPGLSIHLGIGTIVAILVPALR